MPSVPKRSLPVRAGWLLAALLQFALPGTAAWADARLDAAESHAVAHIESHTTNSCARIHAPDCALCHFLTAPAVASRATTLPVAGKAERLSQRADPAALPHRQSRPHPQPRAPPELS
jgi:hypothetical protein